MRRNFNLVEFSPTSAKRDQLRDRPARGDGICNDRWTDRIPGRYTPAGSRRSNHRKPPSPARACEQALQFSADHVLKHLTIQRQVSHDQTIRESRFRQKTACSSGGKDRLGRITKQGNPYLRRLLVRGATASLRWLNKRTDPLALWTRQLLQRRPARLVTVALANKLARIAWAIMKTGELYRREALSVVA
jgi:Transposase IS116/IS110/IS902 family